ncbi:hypothetical protein [Croceibacterium aestuarii]|uniref:hypothetical protein n=1 Tax=Croceibacterium aestuarii TaxID=3064139 RepID=UPI00272E5F57|nr:hypothetical protein [Croceibacterium sp. D39]
MRKRGTALREVQAAIGRCADDTASLPTGSGQSDVAKPPLPEFEPVPRRYRHDGWTPERQKAFIEALADCGSVTRAAAMVNMAQANCYTLRRAPGAEGFRAAWDAALDFGVARLKDIAFERAIEGQLHPVIRGGKLVGYHRKTNDALLMFCLRHYGKDASGKRTTINYFSTKAVAGASAGGEDRAASGTEASTTTVRTVIAGDGAAGAGRSVEAAAGALAGFEGLPLDAEAHAAIAAALEACAARTRAAGEARGEEAADFAADDPDEPFVPLLPGGNAFRGTLEPPVMTQEWVRFAEGESPWELAGAALPDWAAESPESVLDPAAPEAGAGEGHEQGGEGVERERE